MNTKKFKECHACEHSTGFYCKDKSRSERYVIAKDEVHTISETIKECLESLEIQKLIQLSS